MRIIDWSSDVCSSDLPLADLIADRDPIAAYIAWGDEPDILPMLAGLPLALPHHAGRDPAMTFRHWAADGTLAKGPWGPQQPGGDAESVRPALIFCPLVGFDRRGGRLGQGGGHYDRYFAAQSDIPRIGVGWSVQEVDAVPTESTDAPLDAVLRSEEHTSELQSLMR